MSKGRELSRTCPKLQYPHRISNLLVDCVRSKEGKVVVALSKLRAPKLCIAEMDEQARRQRPSLLDESLGLASFTEKNPFRSTPPSELPISSPTPQGPISNKNFESKQNLFLLFFLSSPALSLNKSPFEAYKQRHCDSSVSPFYWLWEKVPGRPPFRRSLRKRAAIEAQRLTSATQAPLPAADPALRYIFPYGNLILTLNQAPRSLWMKI